MTHPTLDDFGRQYLRLCLHIEKHVEGYVDAYLGPPDLKDAVDAVGQREPAALLDDLAKLKEQRPAADPQRARYLDAVFRAMDCTIRMAGGESFAYLDEVQRIYDIRPARVDEETFTEAHEVLNEVLPAEGGSLAERLEVWRRPYDLSADSLPTVLDWCREVTRKRTATLVDLAPGESIDVKLTDDQPWSAYNWFLGDAHSLIEFNTDLPVSALDVLNLFAHEGYPGHHTEHQLKEQRLYREKGYAEAAAALLHSPSAVIAEGIATTALEIIFPGREAHEWTVDGILYPQNLPPAIPADMQAISRAREALRAVSGNAAILYHTGELDEEATVEYIQTYALASEKRARQSFRFISNPLFRSYIFTYTEGYRLIDAAAKGEDKTPLFKRLLVEQLLPSDLAAM